MDGLDLADGGILCMRRPGPHCHDARGIALAHQCAARMAGKSNDKGGTVLHESTERRWHSHPLAGHHRLASRGGFAAQPWIRNAGDGQGLVSRQACSATLLTRLPTQRIRETRVSISLPLSDSNHHARCLWR